MTCLYNVGSIRENLSIELQSCLCFSYFPFVITINGAECPKHYPHEIVWLHYLTSSCKIIPLLFQTHYMSLIYLNTFCEGGKAYIWKISQFSKIKMHYIANFHQILKSLLQGTYKSMLFWYIETIHLNMCYKITICFIYLPSIFASVPSKLSAMSLQ